MKPGGLALVLTLVLAGCVTPASEEIAAASTAAPVASNVARYRADGTPAPLDDALGVASYALTGFKGGEPNVGITKSGAIFATAGDLVIRSRDGGASWERVWAFGLERVGAPVDPLRNFDPMLWVDPVTDRVFADPMWPALTCSHLAWSDNEGESWTERPLVCHPPPMDHQKLASGIPGPNAPAVAGKLYPTVLYQCYNAIVATVCAVSYDGGIDWVQHTVAADEARTGCGGTNGHPAIAPDGTVAVPISSCDKGLLVATSKDTGLSWQLASIPEGGVEGIDPDLAFGPDGTLYAFYEGSDHLVHLARTSDLGKTWDGPWPVAPPGITAAVFTVIGAGDEGKIAMAFLGTADAKGDPSDAPDDARWHLYVVTSDDALAALPTFTSYRVTPEDDPVQVGCVWMRGFPGAPCRNMADFIDAAIGPDGLFRVIYVEGCTDGCAGKETAKGDDSRDREVSLATLGGWTIRAAAEAEATSTELRVLD